MGINWDAVAAIGQCLGAIATFAAVCVALWPYSKKLNFEFTLSRYLHNEPVLIIINNGLRGKLIEKIDFFSGHPVFKKYIWSINFIDFRDDLASTHDTVFISANSMKEIHFSCVRIFHDFDASGLSVNKRSQLHLKITEHNSKHHIIRTNINTSEFLEFIEGRFIEEQRQVAEKHRWSTINPSDYEL